MSEKRELPYKPLGVHLKRLREKLQETVAEVSGAVEIEIDALQRIEQGYSRPSEDILELLINHFAIKDSEAKKLWDLAGYDPKDWLDERDNEPTASVVVLPVDARISYTDMVNVVVNDYGVIMNFMQSSGPNSQPMIVSRMGMSKEHARSIIDLLQKTLAQSEPKALPPANQNADQSDLN